jgi:hypothetical protein
MAMEAGEADFNVFTSFERIAATTAQRCGGDPPAAQETA